MMLRPSLPSYSVPLARLSELAAVVALGRGGSEGAPNAKIDALECDTCARTGDAASVGYGCSSVGRAGWMS